MGFAYRSDLYRGFCSATAGLTGILSRPESTSENPFEIELCQRLCQMSLFLSKYLRKGSCKQPTLCTNGLWFAAENI